MLYPGSEIGDPSRRYRITRDVGRGGMGEVYEGVQLSLGRRVAIKTIRDDLAPRPDLLARFRREAEAAAALGHPNLVQVTDFQSNAGEPAFLVMEMLEGGTLSNALEATGRIEPARAAFIGVQALSGLAAAHRAGIIHRDVKPANLFLQSTTAMRDIVKVLDFGIAKLAIESVGGAAVGTELMTRVGQVLGTLSYMAPEQGTIGGVIDARTDIYALGATLFHSISGKRPFEATAPGGRRAPLTELAPWVSPDLAEIIERALERSPDQRWPSADAMGAALAPFAGTAASGGPGLAPRTSQPQGWDPSAIGALAAPTAGGTKDWSVHNASGPLPLGAVPYVPPPPAYGPSPYSAAPYPMAPFAPQGMPVRPAGMSTGAKLGLVGGLVLVVLLVAIPQVISAMAVRRATDPTNLANLVDKQMLTQPRQPCPAPDTCTLQREENDLKYPLCTRKLPNITPYKAGDFVFANGGGETPRIGVVMAPPTGSNYRVRMLAAQKEMSLPDDAIIGRLCTPGVKRTNDGRDRDVP